MSAPPPIQDPPEQAAPPDDSFATSRTDDSADAEPPLSAAEAPTNLVSQATSAVHQSVRARLGTMFVAFSHRDFVLLWIGSILSNIGSFVQIVALQSVIWDLTHDERWLGAFQLFQWIPTVLFLPIGGVIADRLDRRALMIWGNVGETILAIALAVLFITHMLRPEFILLIAAASGTMAAGVVPASQALFPQLVGQKDLSNAIALNTMQYNVSRAIGPMLGALALVYLGITWSFLINALSFLAVIWALWAMKQYPMPPRTSGESIYGSIIGGFKYVRSRKDIIVIEILIVVGAFSAAPLFSMLPAYAEKVYHPATLAENTAMFGTLLTCFGAGAAVGAGYIASRGRKIAHPWGAFPLFGLYCLATIGMAFHPAFWLCKCLIFTAGFFFMNAGNRLFSAVISSTPATLRGRVASIHFLCFSTGLPLGGAVAGVISNRFGVDRVLGLYSAVLLIVIGVLLWYRTRHQIRFQQDAHLDATDVKT